MRLAAFLLLAAIVSAVPDVYVDNNGYKNMVVAIDKDVPYDPLLIPKIKVRWFKSSQQGVTL